VAPVADSAPEARIVRSSSKAASAAVAASGSPWGEKKGRRRTRFGVARLAGSGSVRALMTSHARSSGSGLEFRGRGVSGGRVVRDSNTGGGGKIKGGGRARVNPLEPRHGSSELICTYT